MRAARQLVMKLAAFSFLCGSSKSVVVLKTADTLAMGTVDLEPIGRATGRARSQFLGSSSSSVTHRATSEASWSDKVREHQDPYAPDPPGAATVDAWCDQPEIHDPVCMANPVAMTIDKEIEAVMRHMMCRLKRPGTCGAPASNSSPTLAPSTKRTQATTAQPVAGAVSERETSPSHRKHESGEAGQPGKAGKSSQAAGEADSSTQPAIHDKTAEEAAEKLTGLVEQMDDISTDLDKKGELDPELGRTTREIIETGRDTVVDLKKLADESDVQADRGLDGLVHKAEKLDLSVFKFQTEVHPHGYKWWRFRWEYAFVEANTLNALVFVAMGLYFVLHQLSDSITKLQPKLNTVGTSVASLYCRLCQRGSYELSILAFLAFLLWALEECGLFVYLVEANPVKAGMETVHGGSHMHWPTTDRHLIYTLRTVNMHFFIGMLLYLLLMYHVSHGAICILEQFMKHESPDFYTRFVLSGGLPSEFDGKPEEVRRKGEILASLFNNKGFLGKILTSDTTMRLVVGHFDVDADYMHLKHCVAEQLQKPLGSLHYSALPELPIYPYIAMKLQRALEDMIVIDWRVWVMVQVVLVVQALIHYYGHVAVMELLPFSIAFCVVILTCQFVWTRRMASYVVDPKNHFETDVVADNSFANWMLWVQQLNFFFLCFSAARLFFSSFFWIDYFSMTCVLAGVFLCLYLVFVLMGSLIVPMFIIMLSVQRVTEEDVHDMKMILQMHVDSEVRGEAVSPTASEKHRRQMRHSATALVVV